MDTNSESELGTLQTICDDFRLPLEVLRSAAGFYIGTACDGIPVSRESVEYFRSREAALSALATGAWTQRASA